MKFIIANTFFEELSIHTEIK